MTYRQALLKRKIEQIVIFPFVLTGKIYGLLKPLNINAKVFLFFPSDDIGGATRVNADIANCLSDSAPLIIFSKKAKNKGHNKLFRGMRIINLSSKIDNKAYHFLNIFYRGVLASWINQVEKPIVLGGESLFFYKVIPFIKKESVILEVCHLPTWFPYTIGFIDLIDHRIFSTEKLKLDVSSLYRENEIQDNLYKRLHFIENKIDIPQLNPVQNEKLEVIYVGRGALQKRVHLIAEIARRFNMERAAVHFSFVGDVENIIEVSDFPFCTFYGNIHNEEEMQEIYSHSDLLILTSSSEGLPLVVMQMMAHGKIVLSTAVNAIPDYITHLINGLLIHESREEKIIERGIELIHYILENPQLKEKMGMHSRDIAIKKFNGELFCSQYRSLIFSQVKP